MNDRGNIPNPEPVVPTITLNRNWGRMVEGRKSKTGSNYGAMCSIFAAAREKHTKVCMTRYHFCPKKKMPRENNLPNLKSKHRVDRICYGMERLHARKK